MTSYRLPHHGNRSFAAAQDDILRLSSPQRQTLHIRLGWQLTIFLPRVYRSFTFVQDDDWRFPHYDAFSSNCHSEWTQECCLRKTGNKIVTLSEESITLMTPYRLPSSQKQILHIRSGWRLTLSSLWRLTVPGHSERGQECHMRRQGSGIVARSEESITLMTSCR